MLFTMPIIGLLNVGIERAVYRPLRHAPRLAPLITAIGVSFILQNVALTLAGSGDRSSPQIFPLEWQIPFGGASVSVLSIFIFVLSVGLMLALQLFVNRSRLGRAMRATAQDQEASALMGVDLNQTIALTFLLGGMLAAAAGVVWGLRFGFVRFDLGLQLGPEGVHRGRPRRDRQHHRRRRSAGSSSASSRTSPPPSGSRAGRSSWCS